jgi:hypothetical protein
VQYRMQGPAPAEMFGKENSRFQMQVLTQIHRKCHLPTVLAGFVTGSRMWQFTRFSRNPPAAMF